MTQIREMSLCSALSEVIKPIDLSRSSTFPPASGDLRNNLLADVGRNLIQRRLSLPQATGVARGIIDLVGGSMEVSDTKTVKEAHFTMPELRRTASILWTWEKINGRVEETVENRINLQGDMLEESVEFGTRYEYGAWGIRARAQTLEPLFVVRINAPHMEWYAEGKDVSRLYSFVLNGDRLDVEPFLDERAHPEIRRGERSTWSHPLSQTGWVPGVDELTDFYGRFFQQAMGPILPDAAEARISA